MALTALIVNNSGSPGPAPTSHTQPGSKLGKVSASSRAKPVCCSGALTQSPILFVGPSPMAALYSGPMRVEKPEGKLRRGWTTGACATAAVKAAFAALRTGEFPDPVLITLPKGETPAFPLALEERGAGWARAGIIKDAGDDPDVTAARSQPARAGRTACRRARSASRPTPCRRC